MANVTLTLAANKSYDIQEIAELLAQQVPQAVIACEELFEDTDTYSHLLVGTAQEVMAKLSELLLGSELPSTPNPEVYSGQYRFAGIVAYNNGYIDFHIESGPDKHSRAVGILYGVDADELLARYPFMEEFASTDELGDQYDNRRA
jgi:hypothetical protein